MPMSDATTKKSGEGMIWLGFWAQRGLYLWQGKIENMEIAKVYCMMYKAWYVCCALEQTL